MKFWKLIASIVIFTLCLLFAFHKLLYDKFEKHDSVTKDDDFKNDIFIPTNEWQEIKKDQPIPKGLHVQIDMTTGVRRAKLLNPSENEDRTSLLVVPEVTEDEDLPSNEVPEKKLPINLDNIGAVDPETILQVEQKYRSYKDLKKEFKDLELDIATDSELIIELLEIFEEMKNKTDIDESNRNEIWLNVLLDLEYLVHQVDNARLFTSSNGIENIIFPSLNSTSSEVRAEAARLLGAACQNNVPSQIAALKNGAIRHLLHIFSSDISSSVHSSALYGLSCIIRNFPIAQKALVDNGGLGILHSVFNGESSKQLKLQVKVVTLINDLLTERQDVEETIQSLSTEVNNTRTFKLLEEAKEKQRQYNLVNLEANLLDHHWCQHLVSILLRQISVQDLNVAMDINQIHQLNHDNIEKIIKAMKISKCCQNVFKGSALLKKALSNLNLWYKELSKEEINEGDTDGYYTGLQKDIENLFLSIQE